LQLFTFEKPLKRIYMRVIKFGGTSVGSAERIKSLKKIIENHPAGNELVVVVSAFQGVTNMLTEMSQLASVGNLSYTKLLQDVKERHFQVATEVSPINEQNKVNTNIHLILNELENFLHGIYLIKELTPKTRDYVLSFGEKLSAYIVSKAIENSTFLDITPYLKTDSNYGNARVQLDVAEPLIKKCFAKVKQISIVPGFTGTNKDGVMTTLGRGGSDYSAAVLANMLDAELLEIWTDVDGFMTADPRKVSKTYTIENLSYAEAMELSHFGAKVLYTPTVQPAYLKSIPILIKNTLNPEAKGTLISKDSKPELQKPIKGIASIENVTLITLQGSGMAGVTGTSMRLFKALAEKKINVILISQASSETSISIAVTPEEADIALEAINTEFDPEITYYKNIRINWECDLSVIAIVGENMKQTPGIAGKLFDALGRNGVNVVAIAQGSSELNISVVIYQHSLKKALNVVHEGFFLSGVVKLNIFQIGVGTVGSKLLSQLAAQKEHLFSHHSLDIRLAGISNSRTMAFNTEGIDIHNYKEVLEKSEIKALASDFVQRMNEMNLRNSVFVDCTANASIADLYVDILKSYKSVVTANKIACSSEYEKYEILKDTSSQRGVKFLYETNVGAGLPILKTISDLIKSGDTILKIEAVLSGTLTFVFNTLSNEIPLSQTIQLALEKGYSEPDPRIDLSGVDVVRKLLILAREAGYNLEKESIKISPILPESCFQTATLQEFFENVKTVDAQYEAKRQKLEAEGKRWRYVAKFERNNAEIKLIEIDKSHPFYEMRGSDNIVLINTERYNEQPMMIKGPGAGAAVTATGIFADIIRVANI